MRDTRSSQVREDLQSLNMAATFFSTLATGDGPANYAGFMTRMSATLERIARVAVDKDEKRSRDTDERDEKYQPSDPKRQNSRTTSMSRSKPRHRPSTLQASMTHDSSDSHNMRIAPSISSNPTHSRTVDLSIPETIEGFPPVNSSGYVVPMSPGDTNDFAPVVDGNQVSISGNDNTGLGIDHVVFDTPTMANWQSQDHMASTSSPLDSTYSPFSQYSRSTTSGIGTGNMFPESWQVPLTADWQFGDDPWACLFPSETIPQGQEIPLPFLSTESFPNVPPDRDAATTSVNVGAQYPRYTFTPTPSQGQDQSHSQGQDPSESTWSSVFPGFSLV